MPITFNPATKRIVLDSTEVSAAEIWSRWVDWVAEDDNSKYLPALSQVGGDDLGGGLSIPIYIFELNGWRVRPMESNHALVITGNLFVEGGGIPVVNTLGSYNVSVQYTVPVQAQGISTGGGGSAPSADAVAAAVWSYVSRSLTSGALTVDQATQLMEVWRVHGLDASKPLMVSATQRTAGVAITQTISESGGVTTVERE